MSMRLRHKILIRLRDDEVVALRHLRKLPVAWVGGTSGWVGGWAGWLGGMGLRGGWVQLGCLAILKDKPKHTKSHTRCRIFFEPNEAAS